MSSLNDLPDALAHAAAAINEPTDAEETLRSIVTVARDTLPDVDHVGVTIGTSSGRLETASATDPLVLELDRHQYDLHQGPCLTALEDEDCPMVVSESFAHEGRWHEFVLRALPHGVTSILAVRMFSGARTVGVLNMYSTTSETVSEETRAMAQLFATHAAFAYGHVRQVDNLHTALESRELIGNAVGVVMERYGIDRHRAFEYLVRVAASSEIKLRTVATQMLATFDAPVGGDGVPVGGE